MSKVIILTDSTADLSKEMLEKYDIHSIPLYVRFGDEEYLDGVDITTPELYKKVAELNELPKTAAVSPGDFMKFFKKYLNNDTEILYIGIGKEISATHQNAVIAASEFPKEKIHIVNSDNLSSGIALLALKASTYRSQGLSGLEIKEKIENLVPKVRSQFAILTLDYLYKGGRLSALGALFGSMLRVKPIIKVTDGVMDVYKKSFGKFSKALDLMLEEYKEQIDEIDDEFVMITHSIAPKQAVYMIDYVKSVSNPKNIIESNAGCVISSHCGEGTIGILYIMK